jgi:hypothetical protein
MFADELYTTTKQNEANVGFQKRLVKNWAATS